MRTKTSGLLAAIIVLIGVTACSLPRINPFAGTVDPLKEYTLEGSGSEKVLLIAVQGMISDVPKKGLIRSAP